MDKQLMTLLYDKLQKLDISEDLRRECFFSAEIQAYILVLIYAFDAFKQFSIIFNKLPSL
jgi:hypothetical protein